MASERRRFLIVQNPGAGWRPARIVEQVARGLQSGGGLVTRLLHADPGGARAAILRELARDGPGGTPFDAIVVVGGDGSIRLAAQSLIESGRDIPLALVPAGTGNVLANELALPTSPHAILAMLRTGPVREVRLALANGRPFLLMAGIGFDGHTIALLSHRFKRLAGKLAFVPAILGALRHSPPLLEVRVDGETLQAGWIVASRSRFYGGRFLMAPGRSLGDDGLTVMAFEGRSRRALVRHVLALAAGRTGRRGEVAGEFIRQGCHRIEVVPSVPVPVQIDGDAFGTTPLTIDSEGPIVRLIVPD